MTKGKGNYIGEYRNFKAELKRMGVTQTQVAEHLGMSINNFNAKVNGKVPFTVPEIVEIRDLFVPEATLDYLLECVPASGSGPTDRASAS